VEAGDGGSEDLAKVDGASTYHPRDGGEEVRGRRISYSSIIFLEKDAFFSSTDIDNITTIGTTAQADVRLLIKFLVTEHLLGVNMAVEA
jgi:hypothetical protein